MHLISHLFGAARRPATDEEIELSEIERLAETSLHLLSDLGFSEDRSAAASGRRADASRRGS